MCKNVSIDVRCIGEECRNCEDLDIEIERYTCFGDDMKMWDVNRCSCKHFRRCEKIMEHLRKNCNADNEKDGV
jgi:hypothetical protein